MRRDTQLIVGGALLGVAFTMLVMDLIDLLTRPRLRRSVPPVPLPQVPIIVFPKGQTPFVQEPGEA